jgi:RimJ/RimL family protein N-acetyltransferase
MSGTDVTLLPELVMQRRDNWLVNAERPAMPQLHVMTDGKRHPRRSPKPVGKVYARFIPWLAEVISFRVANLDKDLHLLHRWMNDPRVDAFWDEAGDLDKHRRYLSGILADPHMLPLIGCFDDEPFGYFELYWAKENRIAPFYDADDYDRGWHVVVGEDAYRGRRYISAWLPSLMHYMFLDDCRTQRIVGEPAAAHSQQIRNLDVSGFSKIKNFDFPHKRATLVMLLRERFFGDRLWLPATTAPAAKS